MARANLQQLQHELTGCIAEIVELASTARTLTAAEWRALVEAMTGSAQPLPFAGDGANPAEVRGVLLAVQTRYEHRLEVVERDIDRDDDAAVDATWTFRHRRLDSFAADTLAAYIKRVAPRPSIASAFAIARPVAASLPPAPSVQLHRCKTCGAPRRAGGLYGDCLYCGVPLFVTTSHEEIE